MKVIFKLFNILIISFFSASEPGAFAGALANSLSAIIERIGSGVNGSVGNMLSEVRLISYLIFRVFDL